MAERAVAPPGLAPRQALWVLAGSVLVVAPHAAHLPSWLSAVAAALMAWRAAAAAGVARLPGKATLILLAIACATAIFAAYHTLFGREAGVAMLTLMLGLKLLEMRSRRDAVLAVFLGLFVALTHFLYGQAIPLALYLLAVVALLLSALIALNQPSISLRTAFSRSIGLLVRAAPLMLVLFLLFPRLPGPLWGLPRDAFAGLTGLSESMSPGSISRLVQSDAVAFRVEFHTAPPPPQLRYWRGPVLDVFDGQRWLPARDPTPGADIDGAGPPVSYTLTLEPHGKTWVFALDLADPSALPPRTRLAAGNRLFSQDPIVRRTRFRLTSLPEHRAGIRADGPELARAVQLPSEGNPRARALAQRLRQRNASDRALVAAVLSLFREQDFHYTLQPPLLGRDGVDEFLFDTRRGFCEHYAGAFTFLMRAAGIPARVVTGYQGGEFNRVGGYFIVRQSDAHAWSEVWLADEGWVRVDPTAAVAGARIEQGIAAALPAGEPLPFLLRSQAAWLAPLRLGWDALNNRWNQWVLGYDQERQIGLMNRLGLGIVSWRELAGMLAAASAAVLGLLTLLALRRQGPRRGPIEHAWAVFCTRLRRAGLPRAPHEGPLDYAARITRRRPDLASEVRDIAEAYARLRYGPGPDAEAIRRLRRAVAGFHPKAHRRFSHREEEAAI